MEDFSSFNRENTAQNTFLEPSAENNAIVGLIHVLNPFFSFFFLLKVVSLSVEVLVGFAFCLRASPQKRTKKKKKEKKRSKRENSDEKKFLKLIDFGG